MIKRFNASGFANPVLVLLIVFILLISGFGVYAYKARTNQRSTSLGVSVGTIAYLASGASDIANEDGKVFNLVPKGSNGWVGKGELGSSYLGLRFTGQALPQGAKVTSAKLVFTSPSDQWVSTGFVVKAESTVSSDPFSGSRPPSSRLTTMNLKTFSENTKWVKGKSYTYDVTSPIQEVSKLGNSVATFSLILKGEGSQWGRKQFQNSTGTPRLTVSYEVAGSEPTPTPVTSITPTPTPTSLPTQSPTPTVTPIVTPTPTPVPTQVSDQFDPKTAPASHSLGTWDSANVYYQGSGSLPYPTCSKALHESYYVIGPDGKKYPTWHPVVVTDPASGKQCSFGHEHGRDPKNSMVWKQVKEYFYFDANKNGTMDPQEEAVSGLPFGYVNEQFDVYNQSKGSATMRHEDHVGHKVDYANGEGEIATHQANNSTTGGVWVGKLGDGRMAKDTGVRCYYLAKPHQGTSTADAFVNNIHEVFYFADCRHSNTAYNQKVSVAVLQPFGKAGGFTKFMPLCGVERRASDQDFVNIGLTDSNRNYPSGAGNREIISRDCIEKGFLVPSGQYSGNMYEAWPASLSINRSNGTSLLSGINLLFDVEDANRYYNPTKPNNLAYSMDLCYEEIAGGRRARGGACEWATNYNSGPNVPASQRIAWNNPRSGFRGIHRGMYFMPAVVSNAGGSEIWYSDPLGGNAQTTPFTGSIKQQMPAKNINYSTLIGGDNIDPRVNDRVHDDGNGSVYAPN